MHEGLSFEAKTYLKPFGGRALPEPTGGAHSTPPDLLAAFGRRKGGEGGKDRKSTVLGSETAVL